MAEPRRTKTLTQSICTVEQPTKTKKKRARERKREGERQERERKERERESLRSFNTNRETRRGTESESGGCRLFVARMLVFSECCREFIILFIILFNDLIVLFYWTIM